MPRDTGHSPLGGSSAERWINCPGSAGLLERLDLPVTDEPEYRRLGVAAHAAAAHCVTNGLDAWEIVGVTFEGVECDAEMAKAVQVYLDATAEQRAKAVKGQGELMVEHRIARPDIHKDYYGTLDLAYWDKPILDITDYKHGEGVAVDVEWNEQLMYYAFGKLKDYPECKTVYLRIVQPRGFHSDGPVREWMISRAELEQWAYDVLIPAMHRIGQDHTLDAGSWCRFCPAKLVCPMLTGLFGAAATSNPKTVLTMDNQRLGIEYQNKAGVIFYVKALEDEVYRRMMDGQNVPDCKLVAKKANRVYKDGALTVIQARIGDDAFTEPELKSPAMLEKLSPDAAAIVKEWSYTPQNGLTVALASDKRPAMQVQKPSETFKEAVANLSTDATGRSIL